MELHRISPACVPGDFSPEALAWALAKDGTIVGYCVVLPCAHSDELLCFYIDENWRRKGYGTYFMKQLLRQLGPTVTAWIPNETMPAMHFFSRFGFIPDGTTKPSFFSITRCLEPQINALSIARDFLRSRVHSGDFVIDATAGRGRDTAFLCSLVGSGGRVLAVDIQPEAVDATNTLLKQKGFETFGMAIVASHANLDRFAEPCTVDAIMFNLGYLPGGDHSLFTQSQVSLPAIRDALELLKPGGCMTICIYHGGPQGEEEKDALLPFLKSVDPRQYTVMVTEFPNRTGAWPIPVCIVKHRSFQKGAYKCSQKN